MWTGFLGRAHFFGFFEACRWLAFRALKKVLRFDKTYVLELDTENLDTSCTSVLDGDASITFVKEGQIPTSLFHGEMDSPNETPEGWRQRLLAGEKLFLATLDDAVVGYLWINISEFDFPQAGVTMPLAHDEAVTLKLLVRPQFRGRRIGPKIMRYAMSAMSAAGIKRCFTAVSFDNMPSLDMVAALGFVNVGYIFWIQFFGRRRFSFCSKSLRNSETFKGRLMKGSKSRAFGARRFSARQRPNHCADGRTSKDKKPSAKVMYVVGVLGSGGGVGRQLIELLKRLGDGYDPVVCSIFPPRLAYLQEGANREMLEHLGVPVCDLPKRTRLGLLTVFKLYRTMRRERPTIVHSYCFSANWRATIAAVCARVPVIISSDRNVNDWMKWYHRLLEEWLSRFRDAIIVNAAALKNFLIEKENIPAAKVRVIYNGLDMVRFDIETDPKEVKRELGIPEEAPTVGLVAVLSPKKDIPTFLRAAVRVRDAVSDARFLIVGEGHLHDELEELARDLGLAECLLFVGHSDEVPRLIAAMNVSVLSSLREGCANVILESMAMGKPVVATDVGGNGELVDDGETGFLVSVGDDDALARKTVHLLKDPGLMKEMGQAAREKILRVFLVDRMVKQTVSLYEAFLTGSRHPTPGEETSDAAVLSR